MSILWSIVVGTLRGGVQVMSVLQSQLRSETLEPTSVVTFEELWQAVRWV